MICLKAFEYKAKVCEWGWSEFGLNSCDNGKGGKWWGLGREMVTGATIGLMRWGYGRVEWVTKSNSI